MSAENGEIIRVNCEERSSCDCLMKNIFYGFASISFTAICMEDSEKREKYKTAAILSCLLAKFSSD